MLRKRFPLFADEPGATGGGTTPKPAAPEPETFSKEYVRELRHENAGYRLKAQESTQKAAEAAETARKAQEAADAKSAQVEERANARIIRAEMKALAIKAGIVDLDGLALADLASVKFNDKGELEGADAAIEALKKAKPYLFTQTTSSTTQPPKGGATKNTARDLSDAEFRAEMKREFGIRV